MLTLVHPTSGSPRGPSGVQKAMFGIGIALYNKGKRYKLPSYSEGMEQEYRGIHENDNTQHQSNDEMHSDSNSPVENINDAPLSNAQDSINMVVGDVIDDEHDEEIGLMSMKFVLGFLLLTLILL